jgi:carbon-monoxide dehydrogenase medium subunit
MLNLNDIQKPTSVREALELLRRPGTAVLAGGTGLVAGGPREVTAVVDLSGLGLAYIRDRAGAVAIGATTTLAAIADSPMLGAVTQALLPRAARLSATSILRNQETVAGTLISEPGGIFAAALLALDAEVVIYSGDGTSEPEKQSLALAGFLSTQSEFLPGALVAEFVIPRAVLARRGRLGTVARTPGDRPIVAACVTAEIGEGKFRTAAIALVGAGPLVTRIPDAEQVLIGQEITPEACSRAADLAVEGLEPIGDFRGSAEYRREMVRVLVRRALEGIAGV